MSGGGWPPGALGGPPSALICCGLPINLGGALGGASMLKLGTGASDNAAGAGAAAAGAAAGAGADVPVVAPPPARTASPAGSAVVPADIGGDAVVEARAPPGGAASGLLKLLTA